MFVSMWMTRGPLVVGPHADVSAVALVMSRRRIRRILVTSDGTADGRLVGIASSHDVARAYPPDRNPFAVESLARPLGRRVEEVMTRGPHGVAPATPIDEAARIMRVRRIGALPVVVDHRAVGIITESDVFRAFVELLGAGEPGVRVTFDAGEDEDVVAATSTLAREHGLRVASLLSTVHDGRPVAVVRVVGDATDAFVDAMWRGRHRVLSVLAAAPAAEDD